MKSDPTDRVERLLALLLIHTMKGTQAEKAIELSVAGFTNVEISNLLQTSQGVVATYRYTARKAKKRGAK
jgi:DNA-binding NarL/FixJ family response regulator